MTTYFSKTRLFLSTLVIVSLMIISCNKNLEQFAENPALQPTGQTLDNVLLGNTDDSLYFNLLKRGGLLSMLQDSSKSYTLFVANNNGIKPVLSAIAAQLSINLPLNAPDNYFNNFIQAIPVDKAAALIQCTIIPQVLKSTQITNVFPNYILPSLYNPDPTAQTPIGPVVRIALYPSTRNGAWLNNVPITGVDQLAYNGVIHHTYILVTPPQRYLWDRISTDTSLTYMKAAINRADSGLAPSESLQGYLSSFGPDFTVFAPVDTAFKSILTKLITQVLVGNGMPIQQAILTATSLASTPAVFSNPLLGSTLTPQTVKGIVVYHLLGQRVFTNNLPITETAYPTLLNSALPTHPGLKLKAVFEGPFPQNPFATMVTVKDIYNNSPAAKVIVNSNPMLPDPMGTSDQNYLNGVLHKIDAVLLPQ